MRGKRLSNAERSRLRDASAVSPTLCHTRRLWVSCPASSVTLRRRGAPGSERGLADALHSLTHRSGRVGCIPAVRDSGVPTLDTTTNQARRRATRYVGPVLCRARARVDNADQGLTALKPGIVAGTIARGQDRGRSVGILASSRTRVFLVGLWRGDAEREHPTGVCEGDPAARGNEHQRDAHDPLGSFDVHRARIAATTPRAHSLSVPGTGAEALLIVQNVCTHQ